MCRPHKVYQYITRLNISLISDGIKGHSENINSIPDSLNSHSENINPVSEFQSTFKHLVVYKLSQEQDVAKYIVFAVVTIFRPLFSVFIKRGISTDKLINPGLTILDFISGIFYAWYIILKYLTSKKKKKQIYAEFKVKFIKATTNISIRVIYITVTKFGHQLQM